MRLFIDPCSLFLNGLVFSSANTEVQYTQLLNNSWKNCLSQNPCKFVYPGSLNIYAASSLSKRSMLCSLQLVTQELGILHYLRQNYPHFCHCLHDHQIHRDLFHGHLGLLCRLYHHDHHGRPFVYQLSPWTPLGFQQFVLHGQMSWFFPRWP